LTNVLDKQSFFLLTVSENQSSTKNAIFYGIKATLNVSENQSWTKNAIFYEIKATFNVSENQSSTKNALVPVDAAFAGHVVAAVVWSNRRVRKK
jgi:hypothetical protein